MFRIVAGDGRTSAIAFNWCFVWLLPLLVSANAMACPIPNKTIPLTVSGHSLTVEVADNRASHLCGLAFRKSLPIDRGMLFVYSQDRIVNFWMKNTLIPLSIAFLDSTRRILEIHTMDPHFPERRYVSKTPVRYALEVNQGWFADNGIDIGSRVEFSKKGSEPF